MKGDFMSLNDIENMPTAQKMYLMEALWDSLCSEETEPTSPEWHKELLEKRSEKLKTSDVKLYTIDELKARR
jgi:hypothetical protein